MSLDQTLQQSIAPLIDSGLVAEVPRPLESGKGATVYCCRGRVITAGRVRRAVENNSASGKRAAFGL